MTIGNEIAIKDLAKSFICPGFLYLKTEEGRKFYIMKPGIYLDINFFKKHASSRNSFELVSLVDTNIQSEFYRLLKELMYLQFEKDLRLKSREIISYFQTNFQSSAHFLNFAIPCFQNLNATPFEYLQKMNDTDIYLLRKAIYSAAFSVIISFCNGIYHPQMLKDIYNLTLTLDIGLCGEDYSYFVAQACNQENRMPGSGKRYLTSNRASNEEISTYLDHPERGYLLYEQDNLKLIHRELSQILLYQHELSSGKGFPRGISKGLVSSWESVVILADSLVEICDEFGFENKVLEYLQDFTNEKIKELPLNKVYQRLCFNLKNINQVEETGS
jgi:hypothetical protein